MVGSRDITGIVLVVVDLVFRLSATHHCGGPEVSAAVLPLPHPLQGDFQARGREPSAAEPLWPLPERKRASQEHLIIPKQPGGQPFEQLTRPKETPHKDRHYRRSRTLPHRSSALRMRRGWTQVTSATFRGCREQRGRGTLTEQDRSQRDRATKVQSPNTHPSPPSQSLQQAQAAHAETRIVKADRSREDRTIKRSQSRATQERRTRTTVVTAGCCTTGQRDKSVSDQEVGTSFADNDHSAIAHAIRADRYLRPAEEAARHTACELSDCEETKSSVQATPAATANRIMDIQHANGAQRQWKEAVGTPVCVESPHGFVHPDILKDGTNGCRARLGHSEEAHQGFHNSHLRRFHVKRPVSVTAKRDGRAERSLCQTRSITERRTNSKSSDGYLDKDSRANCA